MLILAVRPVDAEPAPVIVALASDCPARVIAFCRHVSLAAHNIAASPWLWLLLMLKPTGRRTAPILVNVVAVPADNAADHRLEHQLRLVLRFVSGVSEVGRGLDASVVAAV